MDVKISIGKTSDDKNFELSFSENKILFFYPSEKEHFRYFLRKSLGDIRQYADKVSIFLFLNNAEWIHQDEELTFSGFFRFNPDKNSFERPIDFFRALNQSIEAKKRSQEEITFWVVEDITQIIRLKNKTLIKLFLKILLAQKNHIGIISGYLPYKRLIEQLIEKSTLNNEKLVFQELYFTTDNLLFLKTTKSLQHIFFDHDELNLL